MTDLEYEYEERAAIKQFCAHMPREQAEEEAAACVQWDHTRGPRSPEPPLRPIPPRRAGDRVPGQRALALVRR